MSTNELWRPVDGWPYEISNLGNVRRTETKQRLRCRIEITADLYRARVKKTFPVHRLVADAFLPKPPDGQKWQVNHKNGDRTDNHAENLEWMTAAQNINHAIKTGLRSSLVGSACPWSRLADAQVLEIVRLYEAGATQTALSKQFSVSYSMICAIVNGRRWMHLTNGIRKGHRVRGNAHALAKLTEADIPVIRKLHAEGMSMRAIGRRYGVSNQTIRQIFTGISWKHVADV